MRPTWFWWESAQSGVRAWFAIWGREYSRANFYPVETTTGDRQYLVIPPSPSAQWSIYPFRISLSLTVYNVIYYDIIITCKYHNLFACQFDQPAILYCTQFVYFVPRPHGETGNSQCAHCAVASKSTENIEHSSEFTVPGHTVQQHRAQLLH